MRKILLFLFVLLSTTLWAQQQNAEYKAGEVIVKFKSLVDVAMPPVQNAPARGTISWVRNKDVDNVLKQFGTNGLLQLMPLIGNPDSSASVKSRRVNGIAPQTDLSQLCLVKFDESKGSVEDVIAALKKLDEVEYAEPNYSYKLCSDYTSEPEFNKQWGLQAIRMPELWQVPVKNTRRPVIAILDSGVETTHPDLAANIWLNTDEVEDGNDSDENGYMDDIHGWNFADNSANVEDIIGHGTHCAGIAAAIGDNKEGICGANPDALIMPVKIFGDNGGTTLDRIIQGLDYAVANGADIISMSFESNEFSQALEDALAIAYNYVVILAAAGNENVCMINHEYIHGHSDTTGDVDKGCVFTTIDNHVYGPRYPAASKYVLGVMATNESGELASFSNFDCDGPLRANDPAYYGADYKDNQSYELKAPGENILSTYIGGGYTYLSGTSMACPMAAGAISRLLQCRDYTHDELLKALTYTSGNNIDIMSAYEVSEEELSQTSFTVEHEGVTLHFVKTGDATCQFGDGEQPGIDVSTEGVVIIPAEAHGLSVTCIAANAFKGCDKVTEVELPFNIIRLSYEAFRGCSSLSKLTLKGWIQTEEWYDIFDETTYSKCVLSIPDFHKDYYEVGPVWRNFTQQEYLPYCLGRCFYADIDGVSFPFVVTSVSPKTVKFGRFWNDDNAQTIESVDIPSEIQGYTITSINEKVFIGNPNLVSVKLPPTIEEIGIAAFYCCSNLETVNIPEKVTIINNETFTGCTALTSIKLPLDIEYIGEHAFQETGLTDFVFPKKLTAIPAHLLYVCKNLKHIDIPSRIRSIGQGAFAETGLETVVIGSGVEYIGPYAFSDCRSLKQIEVRAKTPPALYYQNAFSDYSVPLKVPKGCKEVYQNAQGWSNFININESDKDYYNLTYLVDDEEYQSYEIEEGTAITAITAPTKEGYTFSGWSEIPKTMPAHDIVIIGSFTKNFELGDGTGDGTVDISDYIGVANHILGIPQTGFNADAADVNKDGVIDISDYIGVANIILTGKP